MANAPIDQAWLDGINVKIGTIFVGSGTDPQTKADVASLKADLATEVADLQANTLADAAEKQDAQDTAARLQAAIDSLVAKLAAAPATTGSGSGSGTATGNPASSGSGAGSASTK